MAHGYRTLQHWNQWLTLQSLGSTLLAAEQQSLTTLTEKHFGKHALLIGVPNQAQLLQSLSISLHTLLSPIMGQPNQCDCIEADLSELPIMTGSIDLVVLPHTLEFVDNPRQLLHEACRIIKPEGLIVVMGFNPYSFWGLRHLLMRKHSGLPSEVNLLHSRDIKNWLRLSDFEIESHQTSLHRPPINHSGIFDSLLFLEKMGQAIFPLFGGIYILVARAKVIPLTPIKMKWKQRLTDIRISTTIPGQMARKLSE